MDQRRRTTYEALIKSVESGAVQRVACFDANYTPVGLPDELKRIGLTIAGPDPAERLIEMVIDSHHQRIAAALETATQQGFGACRVRRVDDAQIRPGQEAELRIFHLVDTNGVIIVLVGEFSDDWTEPSFTPADDVQPRLFIHHTNSAGIYVQVDDEITTILGWEPAELLGQSGIDFLHPDDRDAAVAAWLQAMAGGTATRRRNRFRTKDGGWRWLEQTYRLEPDGNKKQIRLETLDVQHEVDALDQARAEASRFETLTQSLPVGIVQFDNNRTVTFANQWVQEKMGLETEGVTRGQFGELVHPDDRSRLRPWMAAALTNSADDFDVRLRHVDGTEYRHYRVRAQTVPIDGMSHGVICSMEDITESLMLHERLRIEASSDHLTGLPNRTELTRQLRKLIDAESAFGVLFFDLDSFKLVNDGLGHDAGDQLLISIGRRLQAGIAGDGIVARVGGDEFVVVCPSTDGLPAMVATVESLMENVNTPLSIAGVSVTVSVSVGVALCDSETGSPDVMISNADLAMYEAKRNGGARWAMYGDDMRSAMEQRFDLHRSMQKAIVNNEFQMHLQPAFNMATGEVVAAEALIRWYHPRRGLIPPGYFIEYVAESDLMIPLGWWILNESCRIAARVAAASAPTFRVAVNITGRQLTEPGFADKLFATITRHGLSPSNLALEITETVLISDGPVVSETLEAISRSGCHISLDDFGTGYSSLNHLRDIPVDAIKIDRSYTKQIDIDPATFTIVKTIRDLAAGLGLKVVVEGVETDEQKAILLDLGLKVAQGYLMGRPCDEESFISNYAPLIVDRRSGQELWDYQTMLEPAENQTQSV